ncbi:isopenicillin N synthase family dioxygenase [Hwanghaeella grinnelliae]|uniref:isopenicillin N synthase family dioxygenase n=1 Tax=Hwanghaeella grinnelliae TaxID=2500179 RepID=UPI001960B32A|nr:isopenicillin N synthase family oxygenase [Hwanghaeella grinnelliae]
MPALPIIDLEGFPLDAAKRDGIAGALDRAFREYGFCVVTGHAVPVDVRKQAFAASRAFHALPDDEKRAIAVNEFHRGYIAPKTSKIVTSSVDKVTKPNLSESFMMMHPVDAGDPRFGTPLQGPNQWPMTLQDFRSAVENYYKALDTAARHLTQLLARALGQPDDSFDRFFEHPTVYLRLLHYPPIPQGAEADLYGSAPHTDYGFMTLLAQDDIGGLQVRATESQGGGWIDVPYVPDSFVVNVADLLSHWSGGRWPSTPHRVLNNRSGKDRYSIPFFFDMSMETVVEPLHAYAPGVKPIAGPKDKPGPVCYGDYVMERFNRNYSYRGGAGDREELAGQ